MEVQGWKEQRLSKEDIQLGNGVDRSDFQGIWRFGGEDLEEDETNSTWLRQVFQQGKVGK